VPKTIESVRSLGIVKFFALVFFRFNKDRCVLHATTLSFTTLLSFIPFMVVSIAILASFQVFDNMVIQAQDYFFTHFYPKTSSIQEIQAYVSTFTSKAKQLTTSGIVFLIVAALLMMQSIDKALNAVWHVRLRRKTLLSFLVYWAVLTIGPMLIGISVAVSSYLVSLPFISQAVQATGLQHIFLSLVPFFTTSIAFTLMYVIVPNRPVLFRHAFIGGLFAALLFELAKRGFALYVTNFSAYKHIYGAMSTIPIFMIWIYLSWLLVLLGAEITRCLALVQSGDIVDRSKRVELVDLLEIIGLLQKARASGVALKNRHFLKQLPGLSDDHLVDYLDQLSIGNIIDRTDNGGWVLVRDLDQLTANDLYAVYPSILPHEKFDMSLVPTQYQAFVKHIQSKVMDSMNIKLNELYK